MISIRLNDLHKRMGQNPALNGISIFFGAGLLHGVIGPDGAGKTTLLRTLVGLLRPNEGDIIFSDGETRVPFTQARPQMAYMPQQQSLYADLSISEHLDFFRDLYRLPAETYKERRGELLQITRLGKFHDRPAGQLSGGMYKKLGLMCALLASPTILLLDEPTNGVDPISRREFWELLYRLKSQKILILIATAYMDEAERCDRVHLLDAGRVLATGEPKQVLASENVESFEKLFLKRTAVACA